VSGLPRRQEGTKRTTDPFDGVDNLSIGKLRTGFGDFYKEFRFWLDTDPRSHRDSH
jgi:hypothetical protein